MMFEILIILWVIISIIVAGIILRIEIECGEDPLSYRLPEILAISIASILFPIGIYLIIEDTIERRKRKNWVREQLEKTRIKKGEYRNAIL